MQAFPPSGGFWCWPGLKEFGPVEVVSNVFWHLPMLWEFHLLPETERSYIQRRPVILDGGPLKELGIGLRSVTTEKTHGDYQCKDMNGYDNEHSNISHVFPRKFKPG